MKNMRLKMAVVSMIVALFAGAMCNESFATEVVKKLHTASQKISGVRIVNSAGYTSSTVDLAGGDYDKASFFVDIASGATTGTPTLDIAVQVSPDGGTTWGTASSFTQVTDTTTAVGAQLKQDVAMSPGTKVRLKFTVAANTSWYINGVWAMPSVN